MFNLANTSGDIADKEEMDRVLDPFDLASMFRNLSVNVWAAPDDDDEGADDDDEDGDDEEGSGTGGTGSDDDKPVDDPEKKRLSDEAAKWRRLRREERLEREKAEARVKELEGKDASEAEKLQADLEAATAKVTTLTSQVSEFAREVAISRGASGKNIADLDYLGHLLDKEKVEYLDEDGEIADLSDAIEALLKKKPSLAATGGGDADDSDDDDDTDDDAKTKSTGKRTDGKGKGNKNGLDAAALQAKFPALAR